MTAREDFVFEPFFRTRKVAFAIRRLQTVPEQRKWGIYFERHGCLHCHRTDLQHGGIGMCANCRAKIQKHLEAIIREMMNEG